MQKTLKSVMLPPNSAVVVTRKQFLWISAVSSAAERLPQKVELSVVSKLTKKPIALVDVLCINAITNDEKTFIRDVIKPKISKIASTILEMSFRLILKEKMLKENNISENELSEVYSLLPQFVVLFNNSPKEVELEIPENFKLPNIVKASLL